MDCLETPASPLDLRTGTLDPEELKNTSSDSSVVHPFDLSSHLDVTVIEKTVEIGSDSGVEGDNVGQSLDAPAPPSCDSSIISCCSNYEDAYNLLVRRNSTLMMGSDHGSESSSVCSKNSKTKTSPKSVERKYGKSNCTKPPQAPVVAHKKSTPKTVTPKPRSLDLLAKNGKTKGAGGQVRTTPQTTPTDDGRWPSINSKPAPLMSKSLRTMLTESKKLDTKSVEKYATLPRRKRENKPEPLRDESLTRLSVPRNRPPRESTSSSRTQASGVRSNRRLKTKIYHETGVQTLLTEGDVAKILSGLNIALVSPESVEKCDKNEQVDVHRKDVDDLKTEIRSLQEKNQVLEAKFKEEAEKLAETEAKLHSETLEKNGLRAELQANSQRVLAILGQSNNDEKSSDSLMVLESRFQDVGKIIIHQEEEISKLNSHCRGLQVELEKTISAQKFLERQYQDLRTESSELQEFMQAEKSTLMDALKDAETEIVRLKNHLTNTEQDYHKELEENRRLEKSNEMRWQENLTLQAKMGALEAKCRELLVQQGGYVSGTAVELSALSSRLDGLVTELIDSCGISENELEDVIFYNEAYSSNSNESADSTPDKPKKFLTEKTPQKSSSLVSAVINAIKNAAQSPFSNNKNFTSSRENSYTDVSSASPNELLDSETEPCLMMEPVLLKDTPMDNHSQNLISFSNQAPEIARREIPRAYSLVDQVIDVDNLVTRLLKVIRLVQIGTDECMNELHEYAYELSEQVEKQRANGKLVSKQLKDWEILGARLKTEVKELMQQVSRKNNEIDALRSELNKQMRQVEKFNQDVCELSTALSKAEFEMKQKEAEVAEAIDNWEKTQQPPDGEVLARLMATQQEVPLLKKRLAEKEKCLVELTQEFLTSRHVLTENLKETVNEAKKQYEAIDNALEVLHSNQNVVQQCPSLADLQKHLENVSFQSASAIPFVPPPADYNANAALLQAIASLQIAPIDTTA